MSIAPRTSVIKFRARKSQILMSWQPITHGLPNENFDFFGAMDFPDPTPKRFRKWNIRLLV